MLVKNESYKLQALKILWENISHEVVLVESINDVFYAYGSKNACEKIFEYHTGLKDFNKKFVCEFSLNLNTWFFRINNFEG